MSEKNSEDKMLKNIDEAEAAVYSQIFGLFDNGNGDFVKIKLDEKAKEIDNSKPKKKRKTKSGNTKSKAKDEINRIIQEISEKEIISMVLTVKISGISMEYVNDPKAGDKYMDKDAQIEKIKEAVKGFKNVVVVHSEEELNKLQEDYKIKMEKTKASREEKTETKSSTNKAIPKDDIKETEDRANVYIRIFETDYNSIKADLEKENIIMFTKTAAETREDKAGINLIMKPGDVEQVKSLLSKKDIEVLQEVEGNVDWNNIKDNSRKYENITEEQLKQFQGKNKDKYDYIAFKKDNIYTVFADKQSDIEIGAPGKKTRSQLEETIKNHRNNETPANKNEKTQNKLKGDKEETR